jgi:hypothetical protein
MRKILSIIILFVLTTNLSANDRNVELDKLFLELKKNIPSLSSRIAQQIWTVMEYSSYRSKIDIYFR